MAANPSIQLGTDGNWAIKEDNLLAYKKDGTRFFNKEFDFTRGSLATFVDKDGLIKVSGVTDTELVVNGDFATDSDWTKGSGWSISNGVASYDGGSGTQSIKQSGIAQSGKTYKIRLNVVSNEGSGSNTMYLGGVILNTSHLQAGSYTFFVTTISTGSLNIFGRSGENFVIDNVSVKEIQLDVPRIDFTDDTTGHLLLEPQSTNLLTYSEDFSQWNKAGVTITSDDEISLDGTQNADLLKGNTSSSRHYMLKGQSANLSASISFFAKAKELKYIQIACQNTANQYANFDVKDGVIGTVGGDFSNAKIENYGNGWYRCSVVSTNIYSPVWISLISGLNSGWLESWAMPNNTDGLYVWGAQLEELSYSTSYIPTYGSAVTRNAEVCNNSGSVQDFNSEEGVLYADIAALVSQVNYRYIALTDGTTSNRVDIIYRGDSSNVITSRLTVGGAATARYDIAINNELNYNKFALSWKLNEVKFFINGTQQGITDTNANVPPPNTFNELLFDRGDGNEDFYGKVKELKVFKRAMSDGELYLLTVPQYQSYQEMATALNYTL